MFIISAIAFLIGIVAYGVAIQLSLKGKPEAGFAFVLCGVIFNSVSFLCAILVLVE